MKETTFYYTVAVKISYDENLSHEDVVDLVGSEIDYDFQSFDERFKVLKQELLEVTTDL